MEKSDESEMERQGEVKKIDRSVERKSIELGHGCAMGSLFLTTKKTLYFPPGL